MARVRNYRAEEARRNELARQRGFTTRAAERGAKTRADYKAAGYKSHASYAAERSAAKRWSDAHSKQGVSAFNPRMNPQQTHQYVNTFVHKPTSNKDFIRQLADYLHDIDPERYPDYDSDTEFWNNY